MFIKSFVTIFLALFYLYVSFSKITAPKEATTVQKVFLKLFTWTIQAIIGANIVVFLYHIWS